MNLEGRIDALVGICHKHTLGTEYPVVVPEPYVPYFPEPWNGLLVLAEAQNLSASYHKERDRLLAESPDGRIRRLQVGPASDIGVKPWNDGTLKLAVKACWPDTSVDQVAVSNAVPWSLVDDEKNASPSEDLVQLSVKFWSDSLKVITPKQIITVGATAAFVIRAAGARRIIEWGSPSPRTLTMAASVMWPSGDIIEYLEKRFSEVHRAYRYVEHNDLRWLDKYKKNKVIYACGAVSKLPANE